METVRIPIPIQIGHIDFIKGLYDIYETNEAGIYYCDKVFLNEIMHDIIWREMMVAKYGWKQKR